MRRWRLDQSQCSSYLHKERCQALLLEGYFCRAESTQPLIGCLGIDIVCRRHCTDQSDARIRGRGALWTGENPGDVTQWLAFNNQSEAKSTQRGRNGTTENLLWWERRAEVVRKCYLDLGNLGRKVRKNTLDIIQMNEIPILFLDCKQ